MGGRQINNNFRAWPWGCERLNRIGVYTALPCCCPSRISAAEAHETRYAGTVTRRRAQSAVGGEGDGRNPDVLGSIQKWHARYNNPRITRRGANLCGGRGGGGHVGRCNRALARPPLPSISAACGPRTQPIIVIMWKNQNRDSHPVPPRRHPPPSNRHHPYAEMSKTKAPPHPSAFDRPSPGPMCTTIS